ncbi:Protein argonaute 10 [Gryganskiella cystojenkinii]|nr:Protein argonaute 10 [Gryganskiella cystojenkinii]
MLSTSSGPIALTPNARRPDTGGKQGSKINIRTNFFAVKKLKVDTIWHYDVSITPEIPAEKARKLWKTIEKIPELTKHKVVFDGRCNAYSAEELPFDRLTKKVELSDAAPARAPTASSSSKAPARASAASSSSKTPAPASAATSSSSTTRAKNEFTIKFTRVARIELEELHRFMRREGPVTPSCFSAIQALNIVMSHKLSSQMATHGRSVYHGNSAQNLGGGIERWDGAFQSIRPGQGNLYANIDISNTAFVKGGRVENLMAEIQRARSPADLRGRLNKPQLMQLHKHFKGLAFTVSHRGHEFKKRYKVAEISMRSAEEITFEQELNNGSKKKISIPQYYSAAYSLKLSFPFLPCVGVKGKDNKMIYFPAEVCEIVPGKRYLKKLNEEQTSEMIKGTCLRPQERAQKIQQLFPILNHKNDEYMKSFQMEISEEMTVVPARVLPAPQIAFKSGPPVTPQQGGWQLNASRKMHTGSVLSSYGVLVFDNEKYFPRANVENFVRELTSTLAENGMSVPRRDPPIMYAQMGNAEKSVDSMCSLIAEKCGAPPQLILVVLPSRCETYSHIKTHCETTGTGIMTQCVLSKKIQRVNKQYCGMLGLKINTKLGGCNSVLTAGIPFLSEKPTIILGADVTHPAPGESRPSVVAVVASMDKYGFKYSGRIKVQDSGQEVIDGLKFLVYELLVAFHRQHKIYPARILFYRDGVSEGQYAEVLQTEVSAVKEACHHINEKYNPPTTFCVVKKRHHARFFPILPKDADRSGNCLAGTVVDTMITHPTEFDFYLQSHGGLQGTSRPTLYHVLMDENRFTSDSLQSLTYQLCHVYSRCPKSVSIVPAVYYSHLLAFRARHYQGNEFSDTASSASGGGSGSSSAPVFKTSTAILNNMYFV